MQIVGNISLALAALLYFVPLQMVLQEGATRRNDGGHFWAAAFVLAPLWLLAAGGLEAAVWRGGLDWTGRGRGWQTAGVLLVCLALAVLTLFSYLGKLGGPEEMPWAARPFAGWAVLAFPLVTLLFGLLTLNPGLSEKIPALAYRAPMAAVAAAGVFACLGMALEGVSALQAEQTRRVQREIARADARDREYLGRVEALDPVADFPELLGFTRRFEADSIREIATAKVESRPDFPEALADALQNGWPDSGLSYLEARPATAERKAALAQPVLAAIRALTGMTRDEIKRTHTFIPQQFDRQATLIITAADAFQGQGVDYVPAVREYRQALDVEETRNVRLDARATLDAWLAKQR
ncbi:MAG: hypothetical protein GC160_08035 [Acidobacteria bacterium]|nr:hypothetical protein [Acidobacteriota bacterium]